jgi:hypothetical protein
MPWWILLCITERGKALNSLRTEVFWAKKIQKMYCQKWVNWKTNVTTRKCLSRAFQWMFMSLYFDNLKLFGQFLCPALGDRSHHQSLRVKAGCVRIGKIMLHPNKIKMCTLYNVQYMQLGETFLLLGSQLVTWTHGNLKTRGPRAWHSADRGRNLILKSVYLYV